MKFAFFGYDFFAQVLVILINKGWIPCKIFSFEVDGKYNKNEVVSKIASDHGIELQITKVTLEEILSLEKCGCEFLVSAAYPYRIPTTNVKIKGINIHPTLLPQGRGPWPLPHIILKQLKSSGVTIHKLTHEFDAGDILTQEKFPIGDDENLESLSCKIQILACREIETFLENSEYLWDKAFKQDHGSYWPMPTEMERSIDWHKSVSEIDRVVRAFGKFESYANFDNSDWLVRQVTVWRESHAHEPGTVIHRQHGMVVISALDGFVCLRDFGPE